MPIQEYLPFLTGLGIFSPAYPGYFHAPLSGLEAKGVCVFLFANNKLGYYSAGKEDVPSIMANSKPNITSIQSTLRDPFADLIPSDEPQPNVSSIQSTLRERIVEHVFVGDALRTLWRRNITDVEILRPDFDAHGYDLVVCRGLIVRHIQF
jgi:hypothetical protein